MSAPARSRSLGILRLGRAAGAATLLLATLVAISLAESDRPPVYVERAVPDGGALTGTVRGAAPAVPDADAIVNKDPGVCGDRKPSEALIRAADGALKNAVVFIQGIAGGKSIDRSVNLQLDNHACGFSPHVLAIVVGQRLTISNSDPVLHNAHAYLGGTETIFNVALPVQNQRVSKTIRRPGLMRVQCDAGHSWMVAWIYAFDHPYFAVTDERGSFRIEKVPPGAYRVTAWQEELGTETQEVTLAAGETPSLTFEHLARQAP
jgi:plastocyanin